MTRLDEGLNVYGDRSHVLDSRHGTDISSVRFDDLDRLFLTHALAARQSVIVDLGCGRGSVTLVASLAGHSVRLYDLEPAHVPLQQFRALFPSIEVSVVATDLSHSLNHDKLPERIETIYSQRFLHYLPHERALRLLSACRERMPEDAPAFLSASGLASELSRDYAAADAAVERRFGVLGEAMAAKHHIREPVCLYARDEFAALLEGAGFRCQAVWLSEFGNVKGHFIAMRA